MNERLVGRQPELEELERRLDEVQRPGATVLAVAGEPGIGKTRLLAELTRRARNRGFTALDGRALEFESDVPFAPLVDALDAHIATLPPRRLDAEQRAELAAVFPALVGPVRPAWEVERYRLHRAIAALLAVLAAPRPLVLTLDDLHWADAATLELIAHLLRRPPRARLLIALGYRSRQAPPQLVSALAAVHALELAPLNQQQTLELLAGAKLSDDARRAIHAATGGNPFYAEQLARTWPAAAPAAVTAAIAQETAALGADARRLLEAAAVLGDPFDPEMAVEVAGVEPAFDELCARDLIRPGGAAFTFRHPIVRGAVYGAAGRRELHARAAAVLERRGAPAAAVAHHLERCARPGDADKLIRAAQDVAPRAPATAARWYDAALALQPRPELLVPLARALAAAGRLERARDRVAEALAATGPRSDLVALCAGLDLLLGRHAEAHARLVAALEQADDRLALQIELALQPGYAYAASPHSDRAARALAAVQHADALIEATLALRATLLGEVRDAQERATRAAALVDSLDDHELAARLEAAHRLGGAELHLNRYEPAVRHLTRGVALARATGQGRSLIPMLAHLGHAQAALGRIAAARRSSEDALDTARLAGPPSMLLWALIYAGYVELYAGDLHAADALANEAHRVADELPPSSFTVKAHALFGTTRLELGDPERALALLERSGVGDVRQHEAPVRSIFWEPLVRTLLAADRRGDAEALLARIDAAVTTLDLPLPKVHALRAHAYADPAGGHAPQAAAIADAAGAVIDAARARLLAGSTAQLRQAHLTFAACGADGHRDHAARLLRRRGETVTRPSYGRHDGELSAREHQIAELVADGLTNRQIAERLHISTKTVEMHLTRAYGKLGVARRSALVRLLS